MSRLYSNNNNNNFNNNYNYNYNNKNEKLIMELFCKLMLNWGHL